MYDPNAPPIPDGMFGITSMPQAAPRPGTATNALAGLTRPTRQPGSVYGGQGGGYPAMPSMPTMPAMPGYAGGAGAGRPGMPAMPTLPGYNTGVVPPGTPNSQVPPPSGMPGAPGMGQGPGGMGSWVQQFMGPNGFDHTAFRAAMDAWKTQRRDWRDARPDRQGFDGDRDAWRAAITDWRTGRPMMPWHGSAMAATTPIPTDPAGIAAAQTLPVPPTGYDPFPG